MRKIIAFIACILLIVSTSSVALSYSGSDYTSIPSLATKLDNLINGKVAIFTNTSKKFPVGSDIGTYPNYYYTWHGGSGYECYAYVQAAYYYLFGDSVGSGGGGYSNSKLISGVKKLNNLTYEVLAYAGVGCGAHLRTTINSDGSYNGNKGHSMIILTYDMNTINLLIPNLQKY